MWVISVTEQHTTYHGLTHERELKKGRRDLLLQCKPEALAIWDATSQWEPLHALRAHQ